MSVAQVTQVSVPEGWIDLGIGQPDLNILPQAFIQEAAAHHFRKNDTSVLQYGIQQGSGDFRACLARFLSGRYAAAVDPDHLFVTSGNSQALDHICTLHTQPGDTVIVEEPTYFLALRIFADHGLRVVGTPVDENGLMIEPLEKLLKNHRPVFVYTVPAFQNPTGATLSDDRRQKLVDMAEAHDFFIVADEVYQMLGYTIDPPRPMTYYDTSHRSSGRVFSLGTFSKILAPGLRLGWMQARPELLEPFAACGLLDSGGGLNPFVSGIVHSMIELGLQETYLDFLKKTYHERLIALTDKLHNQIPALSFIEPRGGYFIWACLPEPADTRDLLEKATAHKVGFQIGPRFSCTGGLRQYMRLSFSFYDPDTLSLGVERLAKVVC